MQVAESDVPANGSAQATLVMSSLRDAAHTFVNSIYTGALDLNPPRFCILRNFVELITKEI